MCYYDTVSKDMGFYTWPAKIDKKSETCLVDADVVVRNRQLEPMKMGEHESVFVLEHTKRSTQLAEMIAKDVYNIIGDRDLNDVYVSSEGIAFSAKGKSTLDLSGYKYVLLSNLYKIGIRHIYTYNPIVLKSVAKMGRNIDRSEFKGKEYMIDSIKLTDTSKHKFIHTLTFNTQKLKKAKNYAHTVDDLVDAYWALRSMCERDLNFHGLE